MAAHDEDRIRIGDLGPGDVALLKNIATEAAEATVKRFATVIGIDPNDPMSMQQDMQWVRKTRLQYEGVHGKVILTAIAIAVGGAINAAWAGFRTMVSSGPLPGGH